jgi:hypothetical protein
MASNFDGPPTPLIAHADSTPQSSADDKAGVPPPLANLAPAIPPDMTLQVNLERPAYVQKIGKQLKDLLDMYDGLRSTVSQRDRLLQSMRVIKRFDEISTFICILPHLTRCYLSIGNWTLLMKKTRLTRSTKPGWHPKQYRDGHGIAILSPVGPRLSVTHVLAL